jgi:histidine ammonia-lyase
MSEARVVKPGSDSTLIELGSRGLTLDDVWAVAHGSGDVRLADDGRDKVVASREVVEQLVGSDEIVYGVTTGFGDLASKRIAHADTEKLQRNLLMSHAVGVGDAHSTEVVRAMLLLRASALAQGYSGCRPVVIERLLEFLRSGIHPVVPSQGSVGASGDLAPLAHLALPLIGLGRAEVDGEIVGGDEALRRRGLVPLTLQAKEGLALLNGTQQMTAVGVLALLRAEQALRSASVIASMSVEALQGTDVAFSADYHAVRPHPGQMRVAAEMRALLRDSELMRAHHGQTHKVQDPYSIRCVPQVHGAIADALAHVRRVLEIEINSATDNPLVFSNGADVDPDAIATGGGRVVSGGNFHGEPVALAMDVLKTAISEIGSISERRLAQLTDPRMSGLPAFLVEDAGLNSGMMLYQYVAAALVSENKSIAHPASVDSIPTSANQEDHVSMGPIAARQAAAAVSNVEHVLALEALAAAQGIDFRVRGGLRPGTGVAAAHALIRKTVDHLDADRDPQPDIAAALALVRSGHIAQVLETVGSSADRSGREGAQE